MDNEFLHHLPLHPQQQNINNMNCMIQQQTSHLQQQHHQQLNQIFNLNFHELKQESEAVKF